MLFIYSIRLQKLTQPEKTMPTPKQIDPHLTLEIIETITT